MVRKSAAAIRKGDRILLPASHGELELVGTAKVDAYDCANNPASPCWKVYIDPVDKSPHACKRLFFNPGQFVMVMEES